MITLVDTPLFSELILLFVPHLRAFWEEKNLSDMFVCQLLSLSVFRL